MTAISVPLNLSDIIVINTNVLINHDRVVHVVSTELGTDCKQCGQYITQYHSLNKTVLLNHLPAFGIPVYIKFQPIRYECMDCKSTTTQKPPWYQSVGHCTQLYAQHILDLLVNSTIQEVAQQENISYKRVINIIKKQVPHEIDWSTVEPIKDLGIDEIALKKGHKDFVVIVSTKTKGKIVVLGVLKDRKKKTVKEFLLSIPNHLAETVSNVCCDMYEGFINAAKEVFGSKTKIIIDRFHVAKNYRGAIETLRKKEMRRLKKSLAENDYKKLKNIMWILRKKESNLSDEEKEKLKFFFKHSPLMKKAYQFRNKLSDLFNQHISEKQAKRKIKQWIKQVENSELTCFDTFIKTLRKLWHDILNYFINRLNSGFVEGLNNKIKVIKRRCYGIFNIKNLFQRISIDLMGYNVTN